MSIATCRRYYSECINGEAVLDSESAEECRKVVSETEKVAEEGVVQGKEFCSQRSNGFYGHPSNCSRILQCFDHELFEYPPCDHNLAFDESKGVCDYREHVDNCADVQSSSNAVSSISSETSAEGCGDNKHGDYVRHPQDCSTFFRCVWDRLLPMSCPDGTVFNPSLDVCDFPDQVKGCN
uniref:Chitin-binding type-2 domain-containing protein n=1 Tax=Ditylenchus dipsaci TaxID=166011 RepID=A0A915E7N9_9BILA